MNLKHISFVAAAALMAFAPALDAKQDSPIPKSSDAFTVYGVVDDWTVYADADTKTCLVERSDDQGNVMQMGLTTDRNYAYVGIFTLADIDIKKEQSIAVAVDGAVFFGEAYGIKSKKLQGDYAGGYILTNNPEMVSAIAEGRELIAFPENPVAFIVDLTGTKRAIEEARKCKAEMN
jgi:hypothetical protein